MAPKVQYDCLFCDATYSIKNSFTNHVNKKHNEEAKSQAKILLALSKETELLQEVAEKIDIAEQLGEEEDVLEEAARVLEAELSVMDGRLPAALPHLQQLGKRRV